MTMRARLGWLVAGMLLIACSTPPAPSASEATPKQGAAKGPAKAAEAVKVTVSEEPLASGQPSLEALGQAVVKGLNDKDGRALLAVSIGEGEYQRRFFAVLEAPSTISQGPQLAWAKRDHLTRSGLAKALREHGGKGYVFKSLKSTSHEDRHGLVLHHEPRLQVADADGMTQELKILGTVVEHSASQTFAISSFSP